MARKRSNPPQPKKKDNKKIIMLLAIFAIIVIIVAAYILMQPGGNNTAEEGNPIAVFDTTYGTFKVELFEDKLPITSGNFIKLVNDGFYDGMNFYRISDNFMIQAGNTFPDGSTKESPYGNIIFESDGTLSHEDGSISMASTGYAVGGSSQFFICDGAQSGLDGGYAVFGKTIEGIEEVRDIADDPHDSSLEPSPGGGKPLVDIIINSITID